jgi:hypothetical protein
VVPGLARVEEDPALITPVAGSSLDHFGPGFVLGVKSAIGFAGWPYLQANPQTGAQFYSKNEALVLFYDPGSPGSGRRVTGRGRSDL